MTIGPTPQRLAAWRAYIESSQRLLTVLGDALRDGCDLSLADYHVMLLLAESPERRLRMGELASRLVFSPSRLTYQIATMERRGLVRRESCPQDRRGAHAVLTDQGLARFRAAVPQHLAEVQRHFLDHLDDADVAQLGRVFTALDRRLGGPATGGDCQGDAVGEPDSRSDAIEMPDSRGDATGTLHSRDREVANEPTRTAGKRI